MDQNQTLESAATQAVFHLQYSTKQAVRYVCSAVLGCSPEQALTAVQQATTFHQ